MAVPDAPSAHPVLPHELVAQGSPNTRRAARAQPSPSTVEAAVLLAENAPRVRAGRHWRWHLSDGIVQIHAELDMLGDLAMPGSAMPGSTAERDMIIGCGAALHHFTIALAAFGWSCTVRLFPSSQPEHIASVHMHEARPTDEAIALCLAMTREYERTKPQFVLHRHVRALRRCAGKLGVVLAPFAAQVACRRRAARAAAEPGSLRHPGDPPNCGEATRWFALVTDGTGSRASLRAGEGLSAVSLAACRLGLASAPRSAPPTHTHPGLHSGSAAHLLLGVAA